MPPNPLRARYEKSSLAFRKLFYFGCQNAQRHFLDFITNIQNRANFLNPTKTNKSLQRTPHSLSKRL
ncbi:hypothetical protein ECC15_05240 [Helicobacter pylori]|nr:hypothetical protein ECB96_03875 [Helicobacter pylori]RVY35841.1 hypothetical protein ECC15_05240 [Helicobacter pylori]